MQRKFKSLVKISLVLVYLVIVAGALVRMTGSGMGCPDWPKCFGYYIPPTNEAELLWAPNRIFEKGQVIIKDEQLLVAQSDFQTDTTFNANNWKPYTKHDYAIFNVYHTWTEYVNRLCGAVAGIACFAMAIASFSYWKQKKSVILLSWLVVFLMGFQAWLGALVVASVLNPVQITTHMVVALIIVAVILYILYLISDKEATVKRSDKKFNLLLWAGLMLSLIQVILGTQVRQFVDHKIKELGYEQMHLILSNPDLTFYIHRTFSFLVIGIALYTYYYNKKKNLGFKNVNWVIILLVIEILSGMAMYYLDFPFGMQTTHLVIASILFGVQYYLILQHKKAVETLPIAN